MTLNRLLKAIPSILVLLSTSTAAEVTTSSQGLSLLECYNSALKKSEKVGVQAELLNQADELEKQSYSAIYPTVSGAATLMRQDKVLSATGQPLADPNQHTLKVSGSVPLFRGFRDYAAIRQRKGLVVTQKLALQNAAKLLFYDTTLAYYNVLMLQSDQESYRQEIEISKKRIKELEGFVKIGRSKDSDVLTLKVTVSNLEGQLENTIGQLENAKEVLAFLIDKDRNTSLADHENSVSQLSSVESYLARLDERYDVRQYKENLLASKEGIAIARGQHYPNLDLVGNSYLSRTDSEKLPSWDISVVASIPIFSGGAIVSQTRQALSVVQQNALLLSQTRRTAEQEIRQYYNSVQSDINQINKLRETVALSKKNFEALVNDYKNSLVTNMDVLAAMTSWQDAVRNLSRMELQVKSDYVKLMVSSDLRDDVESLIRENSNVSARKLDVAL